MIVLALLALLGGLLGVLHIGAAVIIAAALLCLAVILHDS